jgi:hypothetical protein
MPLGQIPPWLAVNPQDFVRAAQAGASAGMGIAELRQRQLEAEQRRQAVARESALREWESQEKMKLAAENLAADRERYAAELASTDAYRNAQLGLRADDIAGQSQHYTAMEKQAMDRLAFDRDKLKVPEIRVVNDTLYQIGQDGKPVALTAPPIRRDPGEDAMRQVNTAQLKALDKSLLETPEEQPGWFSSGNMDEIAKMKARRAELEAMIRGGAIPLPAAAPSEGTATAPVAKSPYTEGQRIKSKKDGKIYVVKNGQPVPE